jgi:hypothetical protein
VVAGWAVVVVDSVVVVLAGVVLEGEAGVTVVSLVVVVLVCALAE